MFNKFITALILLYGVVFFSGNAEAAGDWGPCQTASGVPFEYNALINKTISEPEKNYTGSTISNFFSWNLGTTYSGVCECPDSPTPQPTYYKTKSDLPLGHNANYLVLNEHIEIASSVYVVNNGFVNAPFTDVSNKTNRAKCVTDVAP